jgi:predicted ATP-grasp superfamily ATP-dependent carboligase
MPPLAYHDEKTIMNAIVLDGEQRAALAVTRSLGRRGVTVFVGSEKGPSLSSCSRYCSKSFVYPTPYRDPAGFLQSLIGFAKSCGDTVLFPITDVALTEILLHKEILPGNLRVPFDSYDKYAQLTDKINLFRMARELNVNVPSTLLSTDYDLRNPEIIVKNVSEFGFPVVIKSCASKIRTDSGWMDSRVNYANSEENLRKILAQEIYLKFPFLVQKRINGPGIGIFFLMKEGQVLAKFAHRRIREKPPSGGVSVLSEGIDPPQEAADAALKILERIRWTGIAMVEFKIDSQEKVAKLLEVNARFWGSLQLSIFSGVDFPYLLFCLARGEDIVKPEGYTVGVQSRWELGDLDHLLIRMLKNPSAANLPLNQPTRLKLLKNFILDFFRSSVRNEILQRGDTTPFFHELNEYIHYCLR